MSLNRALFFSRIGSNRRTVWGKRGPPANLGSTPDAIPGLTLLGIALYSFFAIAGNLLRGWQSEHVAFART